MVWAWIALLVFAWLAGMAILLAFLAGSQVVNERWDHSSRSDAEHHHRRAA